MQRKIIEKNILSTKEKFQRLKYLSMDFYLSIKKIDLIKRRKSSKREHRSDRAERSSFTGEDLSERGPTICRRYFRSRSVDFESRFALTVEYKTRRVPRAAKYRKIHSFSRENGQKTRGDTEETRE